MRAGRGSVRRFEFGDPRGDYASGVNQALIAREKNLCREKEFQLPTLTC